jgi:hypothetical protein
MNYQFNEYTTRQYKWQAYFSPHNPNFSEIYSWCWVTFGPPGPRPKPNAPGVWDSHGGWIKLSTDEELVLFKLRWS